MELPHLRADALYNIWATSIFKQLGKFTVISKLTIFAVYGFLPHYLFFKKCLYKAGWLNISVFLCRVFCDCCNKVIDDQCNRQSLMDSSYVGNQGYVFSLLLKRNWWKTGFQIELKDLTVGRETFNTGLQCFPKHNTVPFRTKTQDRTKWAFSSQRTALWNATNKKNMLYTAKSVIKGWCYQVY